jgi:hypothetical protein
MSDKNKNKKGLLKDFITYHKGEMKSRERNSFERELQKDPFGDEAEEGYSKLSAEIIKNDISLLQKRMTNRLKQRRTIVFYRIAAAVTVLIVVSGILFVTQKKDKPLTISENLIEKKVITPLTIRTPEPIKRSSVTKDDKTNVVTAPVMEKSKADDQLAADEYEETQVEITQNEEPVQAMSKVSEGLVAEKAISTSGEDVKRSATIENNIDLVRPASIPNAAKSKSLSEYLPAQPVVGLDSFNLYIEKNIRYPVAKESEEKVVALSFTVKTDSTILDIKIITSPGSAWAEEAIRLLKNGPIWEPALENGMPKEDQASVRIIFR